MTVNDALELLRNKVDAYDAEMGGKGGKSRAARELGYSAGLVTQVLNGTYPGNLDNVAARIIDIYGQVICPILGTIPGPRCIEERSKVFAQATDIDLYRACRQCERGGKPC